MSEKTKQRYTVKKIDKKAYGIWDSLEKRYICFRETEILAKSVARKANEA